MTDQWNVHGHNTVARMKATGRESGVAIPEKNTALVNIATPDSRSASSGLRDRIPAQGGCRGPE
ncbi:hypothetical protein HNQ50_000882 [Silvimonas terrae]|uniref:Uncharacterized protein n=1 Tax=Silvimonas terrae TaxID=300266 RepID=A0A840RCT0_9NEIS|nr:hypothetical protein [Silvimonas terrae]